MRVGEECFLCVKVVWQPNSARPPRRALSGRWAVRVGHWQMHLSSLLLTISQVDTFYLLQSSVRRVHLAPTELAQHKCLGPAPRTLTPSHPHLTMGCGSSTPAEDGTFSGVLSGDQSPWDALMEQEWALVDKGACLAGAWQPLAALQLHDGWGRIPHLGHEVPRD